MVIFTAPFGRPRARRAVNSSSFSFSIAFFLSKKWKCWEIIADFAFYVRRMYLK
jgi:hypothetical protein